MRGSVTVKGNVPGLSLSSGTWFGFEGKWVNHPEYGRQIQITRAPVIKEWTAQVAVSMLTSNGVGGRVARRIEAELGPDMVPALDDADEGVRRIAVELLREMTEQNFGYRPEATLAENAEAIRKWREWIAKKPKG